MNISVVKWEMDKFEKISQIFRLNTGFVDQYIGDVAKLYLELQVAFDGCLLNFDVKFLNNFFKLQVLFPVRIDRQNQRMCHSNIFCKNMQKSVKKEDCCKYEVLQQPKLSVLKTAVIIPPF